jgi:hypothetical protein
MIRIDENTYIDDTLVTCAEYQLFIDEMREQGKYYQPDHWTSCQFPAGQARAPVLGVRFSDAIAFCEWLTQHETGEWFYRLPISLEAEEYPSTNPVQSPLGYWTVGLGGKTEFAWVGSSPPYSINTNTKPEFEGVLDLGVAHAYVRDLSSFFGYNRERDHAFDDALNRSRVLYRARNRALIRALNYAKRIGNNNLDQDIYALQERIASHSPAFEGIRLVKERKP